MGDVSFTAFLMLPALPALVGIGKTLVHVPSICRRALPDAPVRAAIGAVAMILSVLLAAPYFFVLFAEARAEATCVGAGCAQGGIGLMFVTPQPWLSYIMVVVVKRAFFNGSFLPSIPRDPKWP
jgi:hypothetical protein